MERIAVTTPEGQYAILIGAGLLAQAAQYAPEWGLDGHVVVATDSTVAPLYGEALCGRLPQAQLITMPSGEAHKHIGTVNDLWGQMVAAGADRKTSVVALGGGVVGDTVGFAAASYMRGVRLVQMPTTLLAMVDSSVGGKVGVDLPQGKNLVGAFKQPALVLVDTDVLQTLPVTEINAGMAEALKHGLLADPRLLDPGLRGDWPRLVRLAVQVKVDVVQQDPFEQGIRAHLNLGHTFAHAIEQVSHYAWLHGYAVGLGLLAAARLSEILEVAPPGLSDQVRHIVANNGLPTTLQGLEPQALWAAMATDKKWQAGKNRFIVLEGIGQARIVEGVAEADVLRVLEELQ